MFNTLVPSYVAPMYSFVTSVFVYNPYFTVFLYPLESTRMSLVCTRMLPVCTCMLLACTNDV